MDTKKMNPFIPAAGAGNRSGGFFYDRGAWLNLAKEKSLLFNLN